MDGQRFLSSSLQGSETTVAIRMINETRRFTYGLPRCTAFARNESEYMKTSAAQFE